MKEKIKELVRHHKEAKLEVTALLEELNQIDSSKLSYQEIDELEMSKIRLIDELCWRQIIIQDLEPLL